jgi:hypothetical protein
MRCGGLKNGSVKRMDWKTEKIQSSQPVIRDPPPDYGGSIRHPVLRSPPWYPSSPSHNDQMLQDIVCCRCDRGRFKERISHCGHCLRGVGQGCRSGAVVSNTPITPIIPQTLSRPCPSASPFYDVVSNASIAATVPQSPSHCIVSPP